MKVICQKTSVEFTVSGFDNTTTTGVHPIFSYPFDRLIKLASPWFQSAYTEAELRLLYVALFNSSNLVDFGSKDNPVAAIPNTTLIHNTIDPLIKTVVWLRESVIYKSLPRVRISAETQSCKNMLVWLDIWNDAKREWDKSYTTTAALSELSERTERLFSKVNSDIDPQAYSRELGKWALLASNAPATKQVGWMHLFTVKDFDIFTAATTQDFNDLLFHMQCNLPAATLQANKAFKLIQTKLEMSQAGIAGYISRGHRLSYTTLEEAVSDRSEETVGNNEAFTAFVTSTAPVKKPMRHEYATEFRYMQALAKWDIVSRNS
jgi:hypothetical protein